MTKALPKVFFAIGMKSMEEFFKKQLSNEYNFVGEAIYREGVVNNALKYNPDIIIIRETLSGSKDILDIVYEIRLQLPDTRIIFLASDRKPGDPLLAELVSNGVYDILVGNSISAPDVINLLREPNKFSDVAMYRPKMTINEDTKETLFEPPPVKEVVKQVKQTVYVEGETSILPENYGKNTKKEKEETEEKKVAPKRNRRRFLKGRKRATQKPIEISEETQDEPTFEPPKMDLQLEPEFEEVTIKKERTPKLPSIKSNSPKSTNNSIPKVSTPQEPAVEQPMIKFDIPEDPVKEEEPIKKEVEKEKPQIMIPEPNHSPEPKNEVMQQEKIDNPIVTNPPTLVSRNETFVSMNSKQKILTFVGGDHGVGNTQVAYNTAFSLGKRGFKTIFIELKEEGSTIEYLYQLTLSNKGLDYALKHLMEENFAGIENAIIRIEEVRNLNRNAILDAAYKNFPNNVDYLFFSPDYILESDPEKKKLDPSLLKELCMHLLFQSGYHYIILDAEPNLFNPFSEVALGFGTHIFYTITQDVYHIGRAVRNISEINKRINIVDKLYYIVNKFDHQAALSRKDIEGWLKAEVESVIPLLHRDFIYANMSALPILLSTKDKNLKKSFDEIVNHILQK